MLERTGVSGGGPDLPPAALDWEVLPHGPLTEVDDGILTLTGSIRLPIGGFPRRMTVVRLDDGRLVIYSAIAVAAAQLEILEHHGEPAFLVVPNDHHRKDAAAWKLRYPALKVLAPPGARGKVQEKVEVDATESLWDDPAVRYLVVAGTGGREVALQVTRGDGTTLVVNDIVANIHGEHGLKGWLLRLMGFAGDEPHVPAPVRRVFVQERDALRAQLLSWAALPDLRRILVSHGEIISRDCAGTLRRLAASLEH